MGLSIVFILVLGSALVALAAVPMHLSRHSTVAWLVSERRGDLGFLGAVSLLRRAARARAHTASMGIGRWGSLDASALALRFATWLSLVVVSVAVGAAIALLTN